MCLQTAKVLASHLGSHPVSPAAQGHREAAGCPAKHTQHLPESAESLKPPLHAEGGLGLWLVEAHLDFRSCSSAQEQSCCKKAEPGAGCGGASPSFSDPPIQLWKPKCSHNLQEKALAKGRNLPTCSPGGSWRAQPPELAASAPGQH